MKFWRPGITGKLFLAIFATCIVLLISMHLYGLLILWWVCQRVLRWEMPERSSGRD